MNKYRVGKKFRVCEGSGLDSNKVVTVIPMFDWHKADDGTYKCPDRNQVAVQYDYGRGFMYKNRLIEI